MRLAISILVVFASFWRDATASDLIACPAIFCFAYACNVQKCPAQDGAKCVAGCNGCTATFEDKFGNDVTDKCHCNKGVKPKSCFPDPCKRARCPVGLSQCRTDTCGEVCRAIFYDENAEEIPACTVPPRSTGICPPLPPGTFGTCDERCGPGCPPPQLCCSNGCGHLCKDPYFPDKHQCPMLPLGMKGLCVEECSSNSNCLPGKTCCSTGCGNECRTPFPDACSSMICFANQCTVEKCATHIGARCRTACGTCVALFFDKFDNYIGEKCKCIGKIFVADCKAELCRYKSCPAYPTAECRVNSCGGCTVAFFNRHGKKVDCGPVVPPPPKGICPPLPPGTFGTCDERCGLGCPPPQLCCSNGCGHLCKDPYFPSPPKGICPPLRPGTFGTCDERCGPGCPPPQLCCSNGCGHLCKDPYFPDKQQCPMLPFGMKDLCVKECSSSSDCVAEKKCCSTGCGNECRTPFPDACSSVRCFVSQCTVERCATHIGARCRTACGTCVALFVDKFDNYIGEKCGCPKTVLKKNCEDDLCQGKKCPADPNAECRINSCGGCNIEFFNKRGEKVDCDKSGVGGIFANFFQYYFWYKLLYGSMGSQNRRCPSHPPPGPTTCVAQCSSDNDCYPSQACCTYGCMSVCISTSQQLDPRCPPITGGGSSSFCSKECASNADCGDGRICCSNGCGTQCSQRLPVTDDRCPPSDNLLKSYPPNIICPAVLPQCYSNSDCRRGEICCSTSDGCTTQCRSNSHLDPRCPPVTIDQAGVCWHQCSSNTECGHGQICCSNGCGTKCQNLPQVFDPSCPEVFNGQAGTCIHECSSNTDCGHGRVCCSNGCGTYCHQKLPVQDHRCPPPDPDILAKLPFMTCIAGICFDNSQCPHGKICCSNGCSNKCIDIPGSSSGSYDPRCPLPTAPVSQISCAHHCSSNSDCRSNYMCCGLYCGSQCVPKPSQPCDPGELQAPCYNACDTLQLTCPGDPTAQCWIYSCNGCKREFYDQHNRIVKNCHPLPVG